MTLCPGAVVKARYGIRAFAALVALVAGCPSGPLGQRPVAVFGTPETDGSTRDDITIHFSVSDDDLSPTNVAIEYSVDAGAWRPATLVSSSAGVVRPGLVSGLPGARAGITCDVVWDTQAGNVGDTDVGDRHRDAAGVHVRYGRERRSLRSR